MKFRRLACAGLILVAVAILGTACAKVRNPEGWASPSVDGETAYFFPASDRMEALNLGATPSTVWWKFPDKQKFPDQANAGFDAVYDAPVLDGTSLYFASYDRKVFAVRRDDGALLWELKDPIDGSIAGGPTLAGDYLAFGTTTGRLYVIKKADGSPAPGWPREGRPTADEGIGAAPQYRDGTLYVATMGGKVLAIDVASGQTKWEYDGDGAIASLTLIDDHHLFVPTLTSKVVILDTADGHPLNAPFDTEDWVWMKPAVSGNTVFFADFSGAIYGLDITTNKEVWPHLSAGSKIKSSPVIVDDVLVVATREPAVLFIDTKTGQQLNKVPIKDAGTVRADISLHDGNPLIQTTDGRLFQADVHTRSVAELTISRGQQ